MITTHFGLRLTQEETQIVYNILQNSGGSRSSSAEIFRHLAIKMHGEMTVKLHIFFYFTGNFTTPCSWGLTSHSLRGIFWCFGEQIAFILRIKEESDSACFADSSTLKTEAGRSSETNSTTVHCVTTQKSILCTVIWEQQISDHFLRNCGLSQIFELCYIFQWFFWGGATSVCSVTWYFRSYAMFIILSNIYRYENNTDFMQPSWCFMLYSI
jgi:hypothetical protein